MMWRLLTMIGFAGTAGVLGLWIADREPPTFIHYDQTRAEQDSVRPGETLRVRISGYRFRACAISVSRVLYDANGTRWPVPPQNFPEPPGSLGEATFAEPVAVPCEAAVGRASYWRQTSYECNPVHWVWPITGRPVKVPFEIAGSRVPACDIKVVSPPPVR